MSKKVIKIDLSIFFDDERKMACVLVDHNWKSVACLQKRVEFLFGVDSVLFLSNGYFLPPQESIEIFNFCNELKAFVPNESQKKGKKKICKKFKEIEKSTEDSYSEDVNIIANLEQPIEESQKKRKFNSIDAKAISSNQAKRSKKCDFSEITSTSEQISPAIPNPVDVLKSKNLKSKKLKISIETLDYEKPMQEKQLFKYNREYVNGKFSNLEKNTLLPKCSNTQLQKHNTSTPKEKVSNISEINVEKLFTDKTNETEEYLSVIPSSTFLNETQMLEQHQNANRMTHSHNVSNPFRKQKTSKAHMYFDESGEVINRTNKSNKKSILKDKEPKTIVIFRCPLTDVTNGAHLQKPRTFHLKPKNIENDKTKTQKVEIKEHIVLQSSNLLLNCANDNEMTEGKKKESTSETLRAQSTNNLPRKGFSNDIIENTTAAESDNNALDISVNQDMKLNHNNDTSITHSQNNSQLEQLTNVNETSNMSLDCVDLGLEIGEDAKKTQKKDTKQSKLKTNSLDKFDLTVDDDLSSDVEEISEIIDLNETEDNNDNSIETSNNLNIIKVHQILPFSTDMTDLPNIGDIIIFKIPYEDKKQQRVYTNYIAGKAEYINKRTKVIKVLIIDGATELSSVPSQFICNLDESHDHITHVQLKLSEMLEPKLLLMSN